MVAEATLAPSIRGQPAKPGGLNHVWYRRIGDHQYAVGFAEKHHRSKHAGVVGADVGFDLDRNDHHALGISVLAARSPGG